MGDCKEIVGGEVVKQVGEINPSICEMLDNAVW